MQAEPRQRLALAVQCPSCRKATTSLIQDAQQLCMEKLTTGGGLAAFSALGFSALRSAAALWVLELMYQERHISGQGPAVQGPASTELNARNSLMVEAWLPSRPWASQPWALRPSLSVLVLRLAYRNERLSRLLRASSAGQVQTSMHGR